MMRQFRIFIIFILLGNSVNSFSQVMVAYIETPSGVKTFCQNQKIVLVGKVYDGSEPYSNHTWSGDLSIVTSKIDNILIIKPEKAGTYSFIYSVKDDAGTEVMASISITITEKPFAKLVLKKNSPLISDIKGTDEMKFSWYRNNIFIGNEIGIDTALPGEYKVVLTDQNGCSFTTNAITVK